MPDLNAVLFHVDVLPEYRESWAFLRDRAPEYEEEFQIADLNELGRERPLVVGLDFTPGNVREIVGALPGSGASPSPSRRGPAKRRAVPPLRRRCPRAGGRRRSVTRMTVSARRPVIVRKSATRRFPA